MFSRVVNCRFVKIGPQMGKGKPFFPHTCLTNLQQTTLWIPIKLYNKYGWKQCGKRRRCSSWEISPFVTMLSNIICCRSIRIRLHMWMGENNHWIRFKTLWKKEKYKHANFSCFCQYVFEIVCCRFVVCRNGLTSQTNKERKIPMRQRWKVSKSVSRHDICTCFSELSVELGAFLINGSMYVTARNGRPRLHSPSAIKYNTNNYESSLH